MTVTAAKQTPEVIAIRIPSRLELLSVLDRVCESVCQRMGFDDDTTAQVSMSVIEAGTNAIQHGTQAGCHQVDRREFRLHPDLLEVVVNGPGAGFDVGAVNGGRHIARAPLRCPRPRHLHHEVLYGLGGVRLQRPRAPRSGSSRSARPKPKIR
jgi:hypothetical protein